MPKYAFTFTNRRLHRHALWIAFILAQLSMPFAEVFATQPVTLPPTVRVRGEGNETWVLLSGVLGGVGGMQQLEARLIQRGHRVVSIDSYLLSIDSTVVTFAALARRVDVELSRLDVHRAHVVGHAHGAGVALRLAASFPDRVSSIVLLDAGALPANKTKELGRAIGLLPIIAKVPGVRAYMRGKFEEGIRDNSYDNSWFDHAARRAYVDPPLTDIGRLVAMAQRLSRSQEPESVSVMLQRIRVPMLVVLGDTPHSSAPTVSEVNALISLGDLVRVVRFKNVGHFPHEEVPDQLIRTLDPIIASATRVGVIR